MTNPTDASNPELPAMHEGLAEALLAERNEMAMQAAQKYAVRCAEEVLPLGGKSLESIFRMDKYPFGLSVGNLGYASVRLERDIIDTAAQKAGVPIESGSSLGADDNDKVVWEGADKGYLTLRYSDESGLLRAAVAEERQAQNQPFDQLAEALRSGSELAMTDQQFVLDDKTQDRVFTFMGIYSTWSESPAKSRAYFVQRLYELPVRIDAEGEVPDKTQDMSGVYFDQEGNLVKILREHRSEPGVYSGMYFPEGTRVDPTDTPFSLGLEIHRERALLERSHNHDIVTEPFLETQTGQEIAEVVVRSGLDPSPAMKEILKAYPGQTEVYDSRYGNSFSELTREVAKIVGNPARRYTKLFAGDEPEIAQRISQIDTEEIAGGPARMFFQLLKESMNARRDVFATDIPIHDGTVQIKDKSCKDAEAYFVGSLRDGQTTVHDLNGKKMLHKHSGGRTAINLDSVVYRGVHIPAGGLFQRHDDGRGGENYAFVRMTSFALSPEDARDAYSWQYIETQQSSGYPADAASIVELSRV